MKTARQWLRAANLVKEMKKCPRCGGSGEVTDPLVLGQTLRKMRVEASVPLFRMAKAMNISQPYLSDLEKGKRDWMGRITSEEYRVALDVEIRRPKTEAPKGKGQRKDTGLDSPEERAKNEAWLGRSV